MGSRFSAAEVSKTTRVDNPSHEIQARTSRPVRRGIETSSSARSGAKSQIAWMHFIPSQHVAAMLKSLSAPRRLARPQTTTGWRDNDADASHDHYPQRKPVPCAQAPPA